MSKVITDQKKIEEVLTRGVEKVYPDKKSLEKVLRSGKKIKLYCGFDPSAPSLHIGHAIQTNKLSQFQKLGHEVIFLIGDFTGMIGDPSDKSSARKKMTRKEVLENSKNYKKQASAYLNFSGSNPVKILYNSQWSDPLTFKDLIEISSNFTVQQMIQRDMFQERLKENKPIYLHEFLYPLAQGYDSVGMDVDLEIGGNDQMFNMMAGRDLMKAIKKKEKFVLTTKLLVDPSGKKMGKTEGNVVNMDAEPDDMYGQVMSWPDGVIGSGFELATKVPMTEVKNIYKQLDDKKINPRDLKMKLAFEITKINYGEKKAKEAEKQFVNIFQKDKIGIKDAVEVKITTNSKNIVDLLAECADISKSEARRLIKQKAVKYNGEIIDLIEKKIKINGEILQIGKRRFYRPINM